MIKQLRHVAVLKLIQLALRIAPNDESGDDLRFTLLGWLLRNVARGARDHPEWAE